MILVRDTREPNRRWRRGYVIDFDYAIKDDEGKDTACGKRTVSLRIHISLNKNPNIFSGNRAIHGNRRS